MKEWMKKHHIIMRLLAVVMAITLWVVVISAQNPEREFEVPNINIEIIGETRLLSNGLVVSSINPSTISLKVKGNFDAGTAVGAGNFFAHIDVSDYLEPGEYKIGYVVSVPDGITIVNRTPNQITVVIEEIVEKELPVYIEPQGTAAEGLELEYTILTETVTVSGLKSVMDDAAFAVVRPNIAQIGDDTVLEEEYLIVNESGNVLSSNFTRHIDRTVTVEIAAYMTKTVPVEVTLVASNGVPRVNMVASCEPAKVTLYGKASDLRSVKALSAGSISAKDFVLTYDVQLPLELPEGASFKEETADFVDVHVSLKDIDTKEVELNLVLENIPERVSMDLETKTVTVIVRAKNEQLKSIDISYFRAIIDATTADFSKGRQALDVTVRCSIGGYDILGSYSAFVIVNDVGEG